MKSSQVIQSTLPPFTTEDTQRRALKALSNFFLSLRAVLPNYPKKALPMNIRTCSSQPAAAVAVAAVPVIRYFPLFPICYSEMRD